MPSCGIKVKYELNSNSKGSQIKVLFECFQFSFSLKDNLCKQ